jgi:hypothetical protein
MDMTSPGTKEGSVASRSDIMELNSRLETGLAIERDLSYIERPKLLGTSAQQPCSWKSPDRKEF